MGGRWEGCGDAANFRKRWDLVGYVLSGGELLLEPLVLPCCDEHETDLMSFREW